MTLNEWRRRDDLVNAWRESWQLPHMQTGLQILKEVGLPSVEVAPPALPVGVDYKDYHFGDKKRIEGYYEFYHFLQSLGQIQAQPTELPEPWAQPQNNSQD